ncbi:MAG: hypothetical protein M1816_003785 [Peltula sp. TS41687]|nr:MAG: hypothetical protein M1816_003785 [Peltula sp. TS41687]
MSNFDPNAVIRGAQLTIVGAVRALRNPGLFKYEHYKQAVLAVAAGLLIRLLIAIPVIVAQATLYLYTTLIVSPTTPTWTDMALARLNFLQNSVLQVPFFLMSLSRYLSPTLDELFMDSLRWVDYTYASKHRSDDPRTLRAMYYPNLRAYSGASLSKRPKNARDAGVRFLTRYARRATLSLTVYLLSFLPYVGRFVLPAASFYAFNNAVGPLPALAIFSTGLLLPRHYLVVFLQAYFSSRSLMRDLLEPYFSRLPFSPQQKRQWFQDRSGLLFGFGLGFYLFLKIPYLGVLIYGVAEASTAYLITKVTDPPPSPEEVDTWTESQARWRNKVEFLRLPLDGIDRINERLLVVGREKEREKVRGIDDGRKEEL